MGFIVHAGTISTAFPRRICVCFTMMTWCKSIESVDCLCSRNEETDLSMYLLGGTLRYLYIYTSTPKRIGLHGWLNMHTLIMHKRVRWSCIRSYSRCPVSLVWTLIMQSFQFCLMDLIFPLHFVTNWQRLTTVDNFWQRLTKHDNAWQWLTMIDNNWQFQFFYNLVRIALFFRINWIWVSQLNK